ncbi:PEGA domain-containing protein [Patescibacteria group bacterium]|nr:PEGA domain-containing protein [Patescibacteria group bacterium]
MYTAGYRWDSENREIKQTGVLSIDIQPRDAEVFLNDVKIQKKLPIYLPNRAPGSYKIKLALPGYKTWEKDIEIGSKKTTYIKNITLFKDNLPTKVSETDSIEIDTIYPSNGGKYLLLISQNNNIYEMDIFDTENQNLEAISRLKSDTEPIINWSPFADFLILQTQSGTQTNLQIINAKDNNSASYIFYYPVQNIIWSKNTSPLAYLEDRNIIYTIDLNTKNNFSETINDPWLVDDRQNLWSVNLQNNLILTSNNETENLGKLPEKIEEIIDANENRVILKTSQNVLIVKLDNQEITNVQSLNTQKIFYNQNTGEWLTWSLWELWTIYENGETSLLNRTSNRINQVVPLDEHGVVMLSSENRITGFNPGYYVEHELLKNCNIEKVGVNFEAKKIFFLGEVAGKRGLYELEY